MENQQEIATPVTKENEEHGKKRINRKKLSHTRKLAYFASLVAITYILKLVGNYLTFGPFRITVSYIGFFISAVILGPLGGGIVAVIADVVSQFLGGVMGMPNPLIALGNFGGTFLFGIIYDYLPVRNIPLRVVIGTTAFVLWATLGFNALANYLIYYKGTNYLSYLVSSRLIQLPVAYLNSVITFFLIPTCRKCKLID